MSIIKLMDQLKIFLADPYFSGEFRKPLFRDLLLLLMGYFIIVIPIGLLLMALTRIAEISMKTLEVPYYQRVVYGLILGPIVEEIFFRLMYVFKKKNLLIVLFTSLGLAILFLIKSEPAKSYIFFILCLTFSLCLLSFARVSRVINSHFKVFFYGMAIVFAFLHVFNFDGINSMRYLLTVFIIIPQFVLGLLLGYIRLSYGFIYAVGFHMAVNISIIF